MAIVSLPTIPPASPVTRHPTTRSELGVLCLCKVARLLQSDPLGEGHAKSASSRGADRGGPPRRLRPLQRRGHATSSRRMPTGIPVPPSRWRLNRAWAARRHRQHDSEGSGPRQVLRSETPGSDGCDAIWRGQDGQRRRKYSHRPPAERRLSHTEFDGQGEVGATEVNSVKLTGGYRR